jgi:hypothetical protein
MARPLVARQMIGSVFRGYVDALKNRGWLEEVLPRLPPDVAELVRRPPFPLRWLDFKYSDELTGALHDLKGAQAVRDFLHDVLRDSVGPLLRPLISTFLSVVGGGPETLFSRMESFAPPIIKGTSFRWTSTGPESGELELSHGLPLSKAAWLAWEGTLLFAFDVTKKPGAVSETRLSPDGLTGTIAVRW